MQKEKTMEDLISRQAAIAKDTNVSSTDLISRQAAIDAICKACYGEGDYHKCDGYPETNTWCDELVALRALPSAQPDPSAYSDKLWRNAYERGKAEAQQWIPCSERLPDSPKQVLVYARSVHYALAKYDEMREADGSYKKQWVTFDAWKPFYTIKDVIAWMPLPEPYKEV